MLIAFGVLTRSQILDRNSRRTTTSSPRSRISHVSSGRESSAGSPGAKTPATRSRLGSERRTQAEADDERIATVTRQIAQITFLNVLAGGTFLFGAVASLSPSLSWIPRSSQSQQLRRRSLLRLRLRRQLPKWNPRT